MSGSTLEDIARDWDFLVSEAAGQRSRERARIAQQPRLLPPGTLLAGTFNPGDTTTAHNPAATGATATAVLCTWVDATGGDVLATVIARDAEVNDALLVPPADLNMGAAKTSLRGVGIIVRTGVLAAPGATFAMTKSSDPNVQGSIWDVGLAAIGTVSGGAQNPGRTHLVTGGAATLPGGGVYPTISGGISEP